ncbi:PH domain-containing protein [Opitutaceae bacterium]|nr:PH domain-containing protein [Opitutaceae bacterium]
MKMFKRLEERALFWLRVPPEPEPPAGAPGSLQTFRAGKNYLRFRMVMWTGTQIGAAFGLLFSLYFIDEIELQIEMERAAAERDAAAEVVGEEAAEEAVAPPEVELVEIENDVYETVKEEEEAPPTQQELADIPRNVFHQVFHNVAPWWLRRLPSQVPGDALFWIKLAETFGLFLFGLQFFWSLLAVRIDYSQRWYMVTDRSLRLRWGVVRIQETTMSFANLQQVSVHQGPLQRLLKLADVEVRSAGGGSGEDEKGSGDSMHRSLFHAVENAPEIRDLILARLQRYRQAGLGEPDDANQTVDEPEEDTDESTLAAARELLVETRALRNELS